MPTGTVTGGAKRNNDYAWVSLTWVMTGLVATLAL
jgi:hypothetical protein